MTQLPHKIAEKFELIDTHPDSAVQESEYKRLLGFPRDHVLEGRTRELVDWATQWYAEHGRPWIYARQAGELEVAGDQLLFNEATFRSEELVGQLVEAQAHDVVLAAVSAGKECEAKARELWLEGKPDEYFFMEIYGSAVVEHLITVASGQICGWADQRAMAVLPHYSPGYSGWDVSDQVNLWQAIRPANGFKPPFELEVMETGMLRPKKSLLAVFGLTSHVDKVRARLIPCESCSLPGCQYRRVPYKHSRPQTEDVRRLQGAGPDRSSQGLDNGFPLTRDAVYSINPKALHKWSQNRLQLKSLEDRSTEAHFRYEGTTCSGMGCPLEFNYRVVLGPPETGYQITRADCAPAPGDFGHTQMCEYLNDAASLMGTIANEQPLLGRPLNDVLTWERHPNPSGCYCDADRRDHKWGLVLEVIHYGLVELERKQ